MSGKQQGILTIIGGLFRHRVLLLWIFLGTILLTLIVTLMMKKQYASEMKVIVQNTREISAVSSTKDSNAQAGNGSTDTDARVNSEIELLSDSDLMEHLVSYRSTVVPEEGPAPTPGSKQMARAIGHMLGRFDFEPVKKSTVFTITYTDISPEAAQKVLRELERTYLEKHVELSRPAGAFSLFNDQATAYELRVGKAEQRLVAFQNEGQFVSLERDKTALDENLHALEVTTLAETAQLQSVNGEIATLNDRLRALGERITTVITSTPNQQGIQSLVATLADLRNRRIHLSTNFRTNDRTVLDLDQQIRSTEDALTELRDHNATQTSTDNNPVVMDLRKQVEGLLVQRSGIAQSLHVHQAQEEDYNRRLTHLRQITPENNALERELADMRGMNQSIADKRDAARVEDLLDAGQFGNVAVAQQPNFSRQHVKPHLSINLLLGGITAVFLCAAVLLLLESTRSTILSAMDLEDFTTAPVLAIVPESPALGSALSSRWTASGTPAGMAAAQPSGVAR